MLERRHRLSRRAWLGHPVGAGCDLPAKERCAAYLNEIIVLLPVIAETTAWPSVAAHDASCAVRPRHGEDNSKLELVRFPESQNEVTACSVSTLVVVVVDEDCGK